MWQVITRHTCHVTSLADTFFIFPSCRQYTSAMKSPRQVLRLLVPHVASDTTALNLFANAIDEDSQKKFMASIWPKITAGWAAAPHESLQPKWFRLFVDQCSVRVASIPKPLAIANSARKAKYNRTRNTKKRFGQSLGFTHRARESKSAQFANIAETTVTAYSHDEAYPPLKHWMYESDKIKKKWKKQLTSGRRPDTRKPYLPMLKVDPNLLEHDIPPHESRKFRGTDGNLVATAYRHFCPNEAVLPTIDNTIQENVAHRRNVRVSTCRFDCYRHSPFAIDGRSWISRPDWIFCWCSQRAKV